MFSYLELYRIDVAMIAFFSYLLGSEIAGLWKFEDILIGGAVSLISTNFIYSFNSWTDREIDKINKPSRPIPSGKINPKKALIYSLILLVISLIYPFFIFKSYFTLFILLLIPFLGIIYSARPIRLRRFSIPSVIIISTGLITPITLAYFMNTDDISLYPLFIILFIYSLSIVPLKDIEDIDGDLQNNMENLYSRFGKWLLIFPISTLSVNLLLVYFFNLPVLFKVFLYILLLTSILIILFFRFFRKNFNSLYQILIKFVIIISIVSYLIFYIGRIFKLL